MFLVLFISRRFNSEARLKRCFSFCLGMIWFDTLIFIFKGKMNTLVALSRAVRYIN
jgi:hypothetical protein